MGRPSWEADFAGFFEANALRLRRTAWGVCGDWDLAEDIVQAAFVRLYAKFPRIRQGDPLAYARRTVVNLCISQHRKAHREVASDAVPERAVADHAQSDAVDIVRALATLPAQQRAVVALRFLDDLSVRDVADILEISEGTVKSHTSRALASLRQVLATATIEELR